MKGSRLLLIPFIWSLMHSALAQDNNVLYVAGSTTISILIEEIKEDFYQETGIRILVRPTGSSYGLKSVATGRADVGLVSRNLKPSEMSAWPDLQSFVFGFDLVVFFSHHSNPIDSISSEKVREAYMSNIALWSEGSMVMENRIVAISKAAGHGTFESFRTYFGLVELVNDFDMSMHFAISDPNPQFSNHAVPVHQQVNQAIGAVSRSKNALAYDSLGALLTYLVDVPTDTIKILNLDGQSPFDGESIDPRYPIVRPLALIVEQPMSDNERQFVDYMLSTDAQRKISTSFFLPLGSETP